MPITGPTTNHKEIRLWAEAHRLVPVIKLPELVDHIPGMIRLVRADAPKRGDAFRVLVWEEFFSKFDELGLAFVYDKDSTGYNELLQREDRAPYTNERKPVAHLDS